MSPLSPADAREGICQGCMSRSCRFIHCMYSCKSLSALHGLPGCPGGPGGQYPLQGVTVAGGYVVGG